MTEHLRTYRWWVTGLPFLLLALIFLTACNRAEPTVLIVTATPEPPNLEATIAELASKLESAGEEQDPADPPATEAPPTSTPIGDPPTAAPVEEPPTDPPTAEPPTPTPTGLPPTLPPPDTPTAAVPFGVVSAPQSVNVRSGPDTAYPTIRVSARGSRLEVIGRSVDGQWWQVRVPDVAGGLGWVSTIYLETQNTAGVPVASAPPLPPTNTPSPTATLLPTPTRVPPTNTPVPPPPPPPNNASPSLDLGASPYFGSFDIFPTHDTQTVDIAATGGGDIDVNDVAGLPGDCAGFVSSAPDVELELMGQSPSDLYIYFLSSSDATLIINDPYGNWYCDDDSYGGGNPLVAFLNAPNGVYDVWIGRWGSSGLTSPGTLIVGEFPP